MANSVIDLRLLEMRSGLFFEYPKLKVTDTNLLFFLPFWENPIISETKEARLVEYNPINRGSSLFAHTGAGARSISIEFQLTIPHIMRSINSVVNAQRLLESLSTDEEKKRFNNKNPFEKENQLKTTVAENVIRQWKQLIFESQVGRIAKNDEFQFAALEQKRAQALETQRMYDSDHNPIFVPNYKLSPDEHSIHQGLDPVQGRGKIRGMSSMALRAINTAVYILDTIRTCAAGHAGTSVLGPPILRLRHGAAYNDVPLICRDYDISIDQDAGYDLKTLIPHRMAITLNTSELRAGNYGTFSPGVPVSRDNLAGWEATTEIGSSDPGYLGSA